MASRLEKEQQRLIGDLTQVQARLVANAESLREENTRLRALVYQYKSPKKEVKEPPNG